jgi:hypothetical protein
LLIVATPGFKDDHAPPTVGLNCVFAPIHIEEAPKIEIEGEPITLTNSVGKVIQPVTASVKTKLAKPGATPVTIPALFIVAMFGLLLVHVPLLFDVKDVVSPLQIVKSGLAEIVGLPLTIIEAVGSEVQPSLVIKVNLAVPLDNPVTMPAFETEATLGLVLTHVPPVDGERLVVVPTHNKVPPRILTTGLSPTVIGVFILDEQPVDVSVNIKVAVPIAKPVTIPEFDTEATLGLLLTHVPPPIGESELVPFTQILDDPVIATFGLLKTVMDGVFREVHPVLLCTNLKVVEPPKIPVTNPELLTVAILVLLLIHVPPLTGDKVVVLFTHIEFGPVIPTIGLA